MANKNDKLILSLKAQIEEKKQLLTKAAKFSPITNCSLEMNGVRLNLHAASKEQLLNTIAGLKSLEDGLKQVLPDEKLVINGFSSTDWLKDLVAKFNVLNVSLERERLKKMEEKLHNLLSTDTKVSLEIEDIMSQM